MRYAISILLFLLLSSPALAQNPTKSLCASVFAGIACWWPTYGEAMEDVGYAGSLPTSTRTAPVHRLKSGQQAFLANLAADSFWLYIDSPRGAKLHLDADNNATESTTAASGNTTSIDVKWSSWMPGNGASYNANDVDQIATDSACTISGASVTCTMDKGNTVVIVPRGWIAITNVTDDATTEALSVQAL